MVNLKKVYPTILHRADMEAEIKAIELIRNKTFFSFEKMEKGISKSLGNYYTDKITLADTQPYHVFSITGELNYNINCLTN